MNLNFILLTLLSILKKVNTIDQQIIIQTKRIIINNFIYLDNKKICVNNFDVSKKIIAQTNDSLSNIDIKKFNNLINFISANIIRLNHVGVGYWTENIEKEIKNYKKILETSSLHLYEEHSGIPFNRWFFIGNTKNWENSVFELALNQNKTYYQDEWIPHFQIDIDTSLKYKELIHITNKHFGKRFIKWKMDIPNYGVVLVMGQVGIINGTKIYLGIGTNLRNTKYQREILLNKLL